VDNVTLKTKAGCMGKFNELMRVGEHKDRHGVVYNITKDVLNKIVETFTPSKPPALLVGHPDAAVVPSLGIVDALKVVGDKLLFSAKGEPEFEALVGKGKFPGVSAGLTTDLSRLDHVAMLSAQRPAIDGLKPIAEFSALPEAETVSLYVPECAEFAMTPDWWIASRLKEAGGLFRGIKNYLIEIAGADKAEALIPEYAITRLQEDPPVPETEAEFAVGDDGNRPATLPKGYDFFYGGVKPKEPSNSDTDAAADTVDYEAKYNEMLPQFENAVKTIATIEKANADVVAKNIALVERVEALEKQARLAEFGAWCEERIAEGRMVPDEKAFGVEMLESATHMDKAEFSINPSTDKSQSKVEQYKKGIMARPCRKLTEGLDGAQFASGGRTVNSAEFGEMIRAYMAEQEGKGKRVSTADAATHVLSRERLNVVSAI